MTHDLPLKPPPARTWRRTIGGAIYGLVCLEIFLRLFSPHPIITGAANTIPHAVLKYVMDPRYPGIDEQGFRNDRHFDAPDVVAIGDSMTYGYNVGSPDAWPQKLGSLTGMDVLNLGIGSYGPLEYAYLFEQSLTKRPRAIVIGVNPAFEAMDVCPAVAAKQTWRDWMARKGFDPAPCLQHGTEDATAAAASGEAGMVAKLKMAARHSAIGSVVANLVVGPVRNWLNRHPSPADLHFVDGRNDTLIGADYLAMTARVTDMERPDIRLGMAVTHRVLKDMAAEARARDIALVIAFMPSRQRVIKDYLTKRGVALPEPFLRGVEGEVRMEDAIRAQLQGEAVAFAEPLAELRKLMEREAKVFPYRDDGHPLAAGYTVIARDVKEALERALGPAAD